MRIQLWSIGKIHDKNLKSSIDGFTNRINKYFKTDWNIIESPKNAHLLNEVSLKTKEAEVIFSLLKKDDFLIILDEKGKQLSSIDLANFIQKQGNLSQKQIIFLIGGAYGISSELFKRAQFIWSLSTLTFPHQLVRLILSEQIYRACSILKNEPYHHV